MYSFILVNDLYSPFITCGQTREGMLRGNLPVMVPSLYLHLDSDNQIGWKKEVENFPYPTKSFSMRNIKECPISYILPI